MTIQRSVISSLSLYTFYPLCRVAVLKCKCVVVASYYAMRSLRLRCDIVCARLPHHLLLLLRPPPRKHSIMGKPCTSPSATHDKREERAPTDPISLPSPGSKLARTSDIVDRIKTRRGRSRNRLVSSNFYISFFPPLFLPPLCVINRVISIKISRYNGI